MKNITILFAILISTFAQAQAPTIQWQKSYGGSSYDEAYSINQTNDGGYIIAGHSRSTDGDVSGNHGHFDYWIVKLNATGDTLWTKSLGGSDTDAAMSINQTNDGGYIVAGYSKSTDGNVSGNQGGDDYWIVKLNATGDTLWTKSLGGSGNERASSINQTNDEGYIIAGSSGSTDGDVSGNHGYSDYWIVKLNATGDTLWTKSLGGSDDDAAQSINQTSDGGYIVAGYSQSTDGDVSGNNGYYDYWIVKLNATGDTVWTKTLDNYLYDDFAYSINQTNDEGYIIAGSSESTDGDVIGINEYSDYWIVKLNATGDTVWTKSLGGSEYDRAHSINQTNDGGYIMAGVSESNDGDVSGNHGGKDYWIVKLSPDTIISVPELNQKVLFTLYPNPTKGNVQITINKEQLGSSVQIINVSGEVVKQFKVQNSEFNIQVADLAKGIYFVKLTTANGVSTQKLILE